MKKVLGSKIEISEANFRGRAKPGTRTIPWSGLKFVYALGSATLGSPHHVELMNPADDAIVQGTVPISAKSDAPSVRFEVFSYTRPSHRTSGTWIVIGNDADPTDGFGAVWDTTTTLNQGGPGGSSVVVAAIALDLSGQPMARSTARVNVANFRIVDGQVVYPYYVVGTCDEGRCGLSLRSGPGFTEYPVTGMKFDNEELEVICQAHGETYHSASGGSSDIWDQLRSGDWVSDYFVDTPERGVFSPPLPVCP